MAIPTAPRNVGLASFFTAALKEYHSAQSSFRVLCSLSTESQGPCGPEPPQRAPSHLLVLDSSFNPPTVAHGLMAASALAAERYDQSHSRVLLLLAVRNADKAPKPAAFPHRLAMMYTFAEDLIRAQAQQGRAPPVDIAVTTEPYFHSKSGAIAASQFYRGTGPDAGQCPSDSDAATTSQIYLTGFDTLIRIFDPKYYPGNSIERSLAPLFARSELRVTMRTNADWGNTQDQRRYLQELRDGKLEQIGGRREWADRIQLVQGRREDEEIVSSTRVRQAVSGHRWDELRALVCDGVVDYIRDQRPFDEGGCSL